MEEKTITKIIKDFLRENNLCFIQYWAGWYTYEPSAFEIKQITKELSLKIIINL